MVSYGLLTAQSERTILILATATRTPMNPFDGFPAGTIGKWFANHDRRMGPEKYSFLDCRFVQRYRVIVRSR